MHTVGPLEGLWSAEDLGVFQTREKSAWDWTMMIAQPDWILAELVEDAVTAASTKRLPALNLLRWESYPEGLSVQTLYVGPYDDEARRSNKCTASSCPRTGWHPRGAIMRSTSPIPAKSSLRDSRRSCANLFAV